MTQTAKITYVRPAREVQGRLGTYESQGVQLEWRDKDGARQSVFGTLFGSHLDAFRALNLSVGDTLTVDFAFTTVERHSFVSNLIELRFPTAPNDPNDPNDPKKN